MPKDWNSFLSEHGSVCTQMVVKVCFKLTAKTLIRLSECPIWLGSSLGTQFMSSILSHSDYCFCKIDAILPSIDVI